MTNILLTGAYGQLGSEIYGLTPNYQNFHFYSTDVDTLDITDFKSIEAFFEDNTFDFVINCAAYTAVDRAEQEREQAYRINVTAPKFLAEIAKKYDSKLIHISTDYVFDGKNYRPYCENDPPNPVSFYGKTKREGENQILATGAQAVIIRTAWLYSAFGSNFVKTMLRLGKERKKLNVVFDQIGSPTYGKDLGKVILDVVRMSAENPETFKAGIYHFSNEGVCSWFDFARQIMENAHLDCHVEPIETKDFPTPAQRPHFSVLNKSKIKETFGIRIPYWKDSLDDCISRL